MRRWPVEGHQVGPSRVEVDVDGHRSWVECHDAPLRDVPEAWGTAFALPASRAGAGLTFSTPIDPRWAAGARRNVADAASWWGGDPEPAWVAPAPGPRARLRRLVRRPAPGRALCFTGGADSFFSLLRGAHRPTALLYVVGFDVPLDDAARVDDVVGLVRTVAAETAIPAVIVRTDLLANPRFSSISWEHTHGAALAAVGHLLAPTIGTVVIPPSYADDRLIPWGSRPDLDPRWSVPGRLAVEHGDASGHRLDRVRAIAQEPLVQRHLRVCWQNVGTDRNCGRCEKCVRTMAMLAGSGVLDRCETFPERGALPARIDAIETVPAGLVPMWADLLAIDLAPEERAAVEALVERSSAS